jgi:hypothetical protein
MSTKMHTRVLPSLLAAITLHAAHTTRAFAQDLPSGLAVHGFMSQAYGRSDGHQLLGISEDGTADYRVAALQFRYSLDPRDAFVVQFSHERLGRSRLGDFEPPVDLDWIFYEHRFDDYTVARVGKVRSPLGIYNEIRDVGTLLPLYRPPAVFYGEQMYTSETVDGATLGRRVPLGAWELSLEGFAGSWEFLQLDYETIAEVDLGYGAQVWLSTPLEGVRVGGGVARYSVRDILGADPEQVDHDVLVTAAAEGRLGPVEARAEFFHARWGADDLGYEGTSEGYYGELVYNVTDALSLVGQAQFLDLSMGIPAFAWSMDENLDRSFAAGVRYAVGPNVVLKLEGHRYRGYAIEDEQRLFPAPRANVSYGLFSVSTSF